MISDFQNRRSRMHRPIVALMLFLVGTSYWLGCGNTGDGDPGMVDASVDDASVGDLSVVEKFPPALGPIGCGDYVLCVLTCPHEDEKCKASCETRRTAEGTRLRDALHEC